MKKLIFLFFVILKSQNAYEGQIIFDYTGTEDGLFSSIIQDSVISGLSFNQNTGDSANFLIAAVTEQEENQFDIFLAVLQDTTFPIEPRSWDIPGEGDVDNPLSLEALVIFMPDLDSSIVTELFDIFTDTSNLEGNQNILTEFFTSLTNDIYLGLEGNFQINEISNSSISGNFNTVMLKPAFYFPPHTVSIQNGEFDFNRIFDPELKIFNNQIIPKDIKLHPVYPNPFNSNTTIRLTINRPIQNSSLFIVDILGHKVETLFIGDLDIGQYNYQWNSTQNSSGIYFAIFNTINSRYTHKLTLIK